MSVVDPVVASDQILAELAAIANLKEYDGDIPQDDPPPTWSATDPRVKAYAVLYAAPGRVTSSRLCDTPADTTLSFQVTCAGGDRRQALWAVREVRARLTGKEIAGGTIIEPFDPGPVRRDDDFTPSRHYVPLLFRIDA